MTNERDHAIGVSDGRLLWVDLSRGTIASRPLDTENVRTYLGGRGLAARLLWNLVPAGLDAESPENPLIFMAGMLTGTPAPASGRVTVTTKSPTTGLYVKSSGGGHFGEMMRFAGYDGIVVQGEALAPVVLVVRGKEASLQEADDLWGLPVDRTIEQLRTQLGTPAAQVACIGPAGENGVAYAAIMLSHHNAAARAGVGTVMGRKKLKAIAVVGEGGIAFADPRRFLEAAVRTRRVVADDPVSKALFVFGTSGGIGPANEQHRWPTRNFQYDQHRHAEEVGGERLKRGGYLAGRIGCSSCTTSCHRYSVAEVGGALYAGGGPEFETFGSLGAGLDLSDIRHVIGAGILCNQLGLDTISAGLTIQWAIESWERGALPKSVVDGYRLQWGDGLELFRLLRAIAYREPGLGELLAKGTARAAEEVGGDAWKWAVQANGLEQSCPETRISKAYALAFAVNPRGPDHLTAEPMLPEFTTPGALELLDELLGNDPGLRRADSTEFRETIVKYHEDLYAALDATGLCAFTGTCAYSLRSEHIAELVSSAVGWEISGEAILDVGERIIQLERAFGVRDGRDRSKDTLPWRILHDPVRSGPNEGMTTSPEELGVLLDRYYAVRGWDACGIPTRSALERIGLQDVADELEKLDRLGSVIDRTPESGERGRL